VSPKPGPEDKEGWESLVEEASEGSLTPSPELERAMREAAEAVEAREAEAAGLREAAREGASAQEAEADARGAALDAELDVLRERHVRLQADFENFRRRALKERSEAFEYGHQNLVKDLVPTVDNLGRAIEHARQSGGRDFEGLLQGVELVLRELLAVLTKHGVARISPEGEPFDPSLHEAMAQREDDTKAAGTVVQVLEQGYSLRDRLIRPARVIVSKRSADEARGGARSAGEDE
jgi:molecular chaperone GrpE